MIVEKKPRTGPSHHGLTRRALFGATEPEPQIASLMIQARPEHMGALTPELNAMAGVEVHGSADTGRMIVTIEAQDDQHLMDLISAIQNRDHVITVSLVYHQIGD